MDRFLAHADCSGVNSGDLFGLIGWHGPRLVYSATIAHTVSRTQYIVGSRSMDATDLLGCCAPFVVEPAFDLGLFTRSPVA